MATLRPTDRNCPYCYGAIHVNPINDVFTCEECKREYVLGDDGELELLSEDTDR